MKTRMPDDYQIPDDPDRGCMDAAYLRTCLGLRVAPGEPAPKLPDAVRRAHYDMARSLSLLGATGPAGMDPTQLATVVALAVREPGSGIAVAKDEPPKANFMDEINAGRALPGQKVVVHWQRKDQPGHLVAREDERIVVAIKGDERRFRPDLVRHPENGEFPQVPDSIYETARV